MIIITHFIIPYPLLNSIKMKYTSETTNIYDIQRKKTWSDKKTSNFSQKLTFAIPLLLFSKQNEVSIEIMNKYIIYKSLFIHIED